MRPQITAGSPLPWLQVTLNTDPQFASKLGKAINPDVSGMIGAVLPYSILVTHNGQQPLIGIDVRFTLKLSGRTIHKNFFYNSFPNRQKPLLAPGRIILFTPLVTANALAGGARPPGTGGAGSLSSPNDVSTINEFGAADEIDISIDLAVAADGRTAGPDLAKTIKTLTQQRDAYAAMRDELLTRLGNGSPEETVQSWLAAYSTQRIYRDSETGWGDSYTSTQAKLAKRWSEYLSSGKRSDLIAQLSAKSALDVYPFVAFLKGGLQ